MLLVHPVFSQEAHAAQVTLAWNANTETDLQGYKVYQGTASRIYPTSWNVGNSTSCMISGLEVGRNYYFSVTALDSAGNESGYSNEVTYTIPASGPEPTPAPSPSSSQSPAPSQELVISQTPYTSWNLGVKSTGMLYAQSFKAIGPKIESVAVALARYRSQNMPIRVSIRIAAGGPILASAQILPSQVTSTNWHNPNWIDVTFSSPVTVTPGSTYYLVLDVSTYNYGHYYRVSLGQNTYPDGIAYQSAVTPRSDVDLLSKIKFSY